MFNPLGANPTNNHFVVLAFKGLNKPSILKPMA